MAMSPDTTIESYLGLSVDEIDKIIGQSLINEQFGSKPHSDSELIAIAKRWLGANLERIRNAICSNDFIQRKLTNEGVQNRNELMATIVDVLTVVFAGSSISVVALTARIIHYGIDSLCEKGVSSDL